MSYTISRLHPIADVHTCSYYTSILHELESLNGLALFDVHNDENGNPFLHLIGYTTPEGLCYKNLDCSCANISLKKLQSFIANYDGLHLYEYGLLGAMRWDSVMYNPSNFPSFSLLNFSPEEWLHPTTLFYYIAKLSQIHKIIPHSLSILTPLVQNPYEDSPPSNIFVSSEPVVTESETIDAISWGPYV